ncbi:MAG: carbohydrate kinase family protein [Christensenellales bacterium]|jgi:sugar/nucleoside kinase (ribokinase family)
MAKALISGCGVTDIIAKPVPDLDYARDHLTIQELRLSNGGDASNCSINLSKMGQDVSIVTRIGTDDFGDFLFNKLTAEGVNTQFVNRIEGQKSSGTLVCINEKGDRTFFSIRAANHDLTLSDLPLDRLGEFKVAHLSTFFTFKKLGTEGAVAYFKRAQAAGCTTTMDVGWDHDMKWMEKIGPVLPYLDYFLPSDNEACEIAGKSRNDPEGMADVLLDAGAKNVIIKRGEYGCYYKGQSGSFYLPSMKVEVLDTTGAGDAYVGGFITGLLQDWDVEKCARFATALAGICTTHVGTTDGTPGFDEIYHFMETGQMRELVK